MDEQRAYEAFLLTLPVELRDKKVVHLRTVYDIPKALYIARVEKLRPDTIHVQGWCKALCLDGKLNGYDAVSMAPHIDPDIPLIMVERNKLPLLLDGLKRLRKAFLLGKERIKVYYFPPNLSKYFKSE